VAPTVKVALLPLHTVVFAGCVWIATLAVIDRFVELLLKQPELLVTEAVRVNVPLAAAVNVTTFEPEPAVIEPALIDHT
jgi:hypothetical protein